MSTPVDSRQLVAEITSLANPLLLLIVANPPWQQLRMASTSHFAGLICFSIVAHRTSICPPLLDKRILGTGQRRIKIRYFYQNRLKNGRPYLENPSLRCLSGPPCAVRYISLGSFTLSLRNSYKECSNSSESKKMLVMVNFLFFNILVIGMISCSSCLMLVFSKDNISPCPETIIMYGFWLLF